jgi:hypothetical protein
VSALRRYMLEEAFVERAARAIGLRHPHADWLVAHAYIGQTGLTDRALEAVVERLAAWLEDYDETTGTG